MKTIKRKVYLSKMRTEIGYIPVLSNFQTVNRPLNIFAAWRLVNNCHESIFFIVRPKDAAKLANLGYNIAAMELKPGNKPRFFGTYMDQTLLF